MKSINKSLAIILIFCLIISTSPFSLASNEITVKLDGTPLTFDVPPQIINGRTMVPLRVIFESLGAQVSWSAASQTVLATKGDITILLVINNPNMNVNGKHVTLDSVPCIINGRTLVPARAVAEAFGANVDWIASERTVLISTKPSQESTTSNSSTTQQVPTINYTPVLSSNSSTHSIKVYSTGYTRGAEANVIMTEDGSDQYSFYSEWVILDFYIEHISSTEDTNSIFGSSPVLECESLINDSLYLDDKKLYAFDCYTPDGKNSVATAKCLPGQSVEFSIAVLVAKTDGEFSLKVPNGLNKTTIICDGAQSVEKSLPSYEYYVDGAAPTYTSITGVPLKLSYSGAYRYEYTSEDDVLKYHKALFDCGYTIYRDYGDRVIFHNEAELGAQAYLCVSIDEKYNEVWVYPSYDFAGLLGF